MYLDDIIVITRSFEEHLQILREVFGRLRRVRLRLNPDKCRFCVDRLKYLGHIMNQDGLRTNSEKVRAIADWPEPRTVKQIRQFLGIPGYLGSTASYRTVLFYYHAIDYIDQKERLMEMGTRGGEPSKG